MVTAPALTDLLASVLTPVTLITGVAFLTSIMAPRFGRCIDRIRNILNQIKTLQPDNREYKILLCQLIILYQRTRTLRNTMVAAGVCVLLVVLTIAITFSNMVFDIPNKVFSLITFCCSLVSLMVLVAGFIYDFLSSLKAIKLEISCDLSHEAHHIAPEILEVIKTIELAHSLKL